MKDIKHEWCVYGSFADAVGKVGKDNGSSISVIYSEGQMYPWEPWDPAFVKRYETPEEAIACFVILTGDHIDNAAEAFLENFPSVKVDQKAIAMLIKRTEAKRKESDAKVKKVQKAQEQGKKPKSKKKGKR